jgi:2',3'-cyclic-nucleotide 2'-phosphodiesterase (5'-nucleotidase family)
MTIWFALLACAASKPSVPARTEGLELRSVLASDGPLESRLAAPDEASLAIFYAGEQKGSLDPCGCPDRPRGGVARTHAYVDAAIAAHPGVPAVVVGGGNFLEDVMGVDGNPRPEVAVMNRYAVAGLGRIGFDALNAGYPDLSGITGLAEGGPAAGIGLPIVSANAHGPGVWPSRIVAAGDLRVAITGITAPGVSFVPTPAYVVEDPVSAGRAALRQLRQTSDLVVLLSFQAADAARTLAREGLADVVIDTNLHSTFDEPLRVGRAIWVRSSLTTMQLGELRLTLYEGRIVKAIDRKIDLDDEIAGNVEDEVLADQARRDIAAAAMR